jgi:hypothetical protein
VDEKEKVIARIRPNIFKAPQVDEKVLIERDLQ